MIALLASILFILEATTASIQRPQGEVGPAAAHPRSQGSSPNIFGIGPNGRPMDFLDDLTAQMRGRRQSPYRNSQRGPSHSASSSSDYPYLRGRAISTYYAEETANEYAEEETCPPNNPQWNKKMGMKIYQEVVANKELANINKYFAEDYIQHNPSVADGREALRQSLLPGGVFAGPRRTVNWLHVAADGDLFWMHQWGILPSGETQVQLDIFRFECGKIAEHWDVTQHFDRNAPAANDHPFF